MAKQSSPDKRLVYLHCSSIFSGANAQVRKVKKVSQLLEKHKGSIKILTKEYTLPAIAVVAKELLDEKIFESLPRAKLHYPELFQQSETQEAERAASEAEVIRIEAEAAHDIVLTSDDEGGAECLDFEQGQVEPELEGASKDKIEAPNEAQISGAEPCTQSTPQAHQVLSFPRLHPVYLPFKIQHRILVLVQTLLEECCLDFGNTWVPDLMEARKWYEAESIELTQWTKRFLGHAKSLPSSAMKPIAGKSITKVLFGTSIIRHSAVHRLPTSAAGILNMLSAAITFAEALNDPKRAERVAEIKTQLEASVKEIVQHQNLLERKLTDQLEDITRRRAELDELERSSIEQMLATDKNQRTEVGSAFESFLAGSQQVPNPCADGLTSSSDRPKADSEPGEDLEISEIQHGPDFPDEEDKAQPYCSGALGDEEPHHETDDMSWESSRTGNIRTERHNMAEEAIPTEEPCVPASEEAFPTADPYIIAPEEEPVQNDVFSAEVVSMENPLEEEPTVPDTMPEASQAEPIMERYDDVEEHPLNQRDQSYEPIPEPGIYPMYSSAAEDHEFPIPPPRASRNAEHHNLKFHPSPPSVPSSTVTSVLEAAAPGAPSRDSHTITLKILLHSTKVLRSVVFIRACTRTAILNEAKAYCVKCARDDQSLRTLLANGCSLALLSLKMYGYDMDLSTYQVENLSSLVRTVEKTGIPRFSLRISEA